MKKVYSFNWLSSNGQWSTRGRQAICGMIKCCVEREKKESNVNGINHHKFSDGGKVGGKTAARVEVAYRFLSISDSV